MQNTSKLYVSELDDQYTVSYSSGMDVARSLAKLMEETGWTQSELAEKLATTQATVSRWMKGADPKGKTLQRIVSLVESQGVDDGSHEHIRVPLGQEFEPDPEFEAVKRAVSDGRRVGIAPDEIPQAETLGMGLRDAGDQIQIDIGGGNSVIGVPVSDTWRVPSTVLRRRVSTPIEQLHFVECEGNSMFPMINNGDVVLVDRSKRNPRMPGVFALWEGDGQTIKQVEFVQGSVPPKLRLIPANKDYTTYEVLADDVVIIGAYVARFTVD